MRSGAISPASCFWQLGKGDKGDFSVIQDGLNSIIKQLMQSVIENTDTAIQNVEQTSELLQATKKNGGTRPQIFMNLEQTAALLQHIIIRHSLVINRQGQKTLRKGFSAV